MYLVPSQLQAGTLQFVYDLYHYKILSLCREHRSVEKNTVYSQLLVLTLSPLINHICTDRKIPCDVLNYKY